MRAEIPWNVAGIPPEAREAARAAARREGLSVGEWLTRRILRSFSGMEEDIMPTERAHLDAWGLPQATTSRRDTEDMLARVGRSETETSEIFGRIEEQLRGLSRRLDSSERSHSESNRVLSRTAQEINIASREQAQVFDQLSTNVIALSQRLERVERAAASDGIREAVKALHQGLSRLADQASQTANQSATQVSNLATSLEQLAVRLGAVRMDAEDADKQLAQRILAVENLAHNKVAHLDDRLARLEGSIRNDLEALEKGLTAVQGSREADQAATEQRLKHHLAGVESGQTAMQQRLEERIAGMEAAQAEAEQRVDQRLASVEKTAQVHTNALDHALEKIEAAANARAADQVEAQRRAASIEENLQGLREAIMRLESRGPDAAIEHRLDNVERNLGGLIDRLQEDGPAAPLQQSLNALALRIETLEKDHNELLAEVRTGGSSHAASAFASSDFPQSAFTQDHDAFRPVDEPAAPPPLGFDVPPFPEPQPELGYDAHAQSPSRTGPFADEGAEQYFYAGDPSEPAQSDPAHESTPEAGEFEPLADFTEPFEPEAEPENFLAQARRTARAAAERAENERQSRGFHWGRTTSAANDEDRPRYLIPALIALIVVLAVAAGLVLSQRMRTEPRGSEIAVPAKPVSHNRITSAPPAAGKVAALPVAKPSAGETAQPAVTPPAAKPQVVQPASAAAGTREDVPSNTVKTPPQRDVHKAPANPAPRGNATAHKAPDRVIRLANADNPVAQTILGLRYLDGTVDTAVNLPEALKYLTAAAIQGQPVAQYRLGTLYERGQGVPADGAKAAHWYQMAANQGNRKAMHNLAVAYASGATGKKNMAEAARWFAKAAALGLSDSQFNLAVLYERGDGVPQSLLDAYKWYSIAAASGDAESKARVGVLQSQLSDSDRAAAQKAATAFHAAPLNRSANVPPEPADLG
ncbi:MAG TPA: hypothetical protein VFS01_13080 [Rhizomicrobium sp.]|nr:hypothetical protein [Rhizomicrobium sp.]